MSPRTAAAIAIAGVLLVTGAADAWARASHRAAVEQQVAANADLLAREIIDVVDGAASAVDVLGAFALIELEGPAGDLEGEFRAFAQVLLGQDEWVKSVQLGPDSILEFVHPIEGNEAAVGLDLLADPSRRALLEPSITTGDMTVQGPVGLVQGGTGIIVRRPLYLEDGSFWGFAALVLDWDSLVAHTRLVEDDGFASGLRNEAGVVIAGDGRAFAEDAVIRTLTSPASGIEWQLVSRPDGGWPGFAPASPFLWAFGLQAAALAGLFVFGVVRRPIQLRTEVERATADLAASEARYQETFEHAGSGIVVIDESGRIATTNPKIREIVGWEGKPIEGERVLRFVHPEDRRAFARSLDDIVPGAVVSIETRLGSPEAPRWCRMRVTLLPGSDGTPDRALGIVTDITERREAAAALTESERRYRELFELLPIGIQQEDYTRAIEHLRALVEAGVGDLRTYLLDNPTELERILDDVSIAPNPTAGLFQLGIGTPGEDRTLLRVLGPETREGLIESLVSVFDGKRDAEWQIKATGSDGLVRSLHLRWHVPVREGRPDFANLLMTLTDVSRLRRTEERLARLVEAKDRFVASVAHELRTPLTAVVGFARTLSEESASLTAKDADELHGLIASHAQEMAHIIEDLLVTGRSDVSEVRVHLEAVDLAAVAGEALFGVPGVHLEIDTPDGQVLAMADPVRVRQIVRNLITNAVRYGGTQVGLAVRRLDGMAVVEVSDDGRELPPEEAERIFEPYERASTEPSRPGSMGLGLTVSRSLARLLGGQLMLVRVGNRNVFRVTLPMAGVGTLGSG